MKYTPLLLCLPLWFALPGSDANVQDQTLPDLKTERYPVREFFAPFSYRGYETDADGIVWYEMRGRYYYHPVYMLRATMYELDEYQSTGKQEHLATAKKFFEKLVDRADRISGLPYFRYDFPWTVGVGPDEFVNLDPPWYSGMAQGVGASVASRLYAFSGDERYLDIARSLVLTIAPSRTRQPALSHIDENGYYWIDLYETTPPALILNGHIWAAFGLYDFVLATEGAEGEAYWRSALSTIRRYAPEFYVPGEESLYSLRQRNQNEMYHQLVVSQLKGLYDVTGDALFQRWAELFEGE